jgi:hypothetical protein
MSEPEITEIVKVQKIDAQAGDVLAVFIEPGTPETVRANIHENFKRIFSPKQVTVLVVDEGRARFEILRAE